MRISRVSPARTPEISETIRPPVGLRRRRRVVAGWRRGVVRHRRRGELGVGRDGVLSLRLLPMAGDRFGRAWSPANLASFASETHSSCCDIATNANEGPFALPNRGVGMPSCNGGTSVPSGFGASVVENVGPHATLQALRGFLTWKVVGSGSGRTANTFAVVWRGRTRTRFTQEGSSPRRRT